MNIFSAVAVVFLTIEFSKLVYAPLAGMPRTKYLLVTALSLAATGPFDHLEQAPAVALGAVLTYRVYAITQAATDMLRLRFATEGRRR